MIFINFILSPLVFRERRPFPVGWAQETRRIYFLARELIDPGSTLSEVGR